jgi:hypothetical protein
VVNVKTLNGSEHDGRSFKISRIWRNQFLTTVCQNKLVSVLTCSMHMHCRPIENNNAQFTYTTKIISFAIKKWSYLSHTTFKRWILERICASHVGLKVELLINCVIDVCRTWPTFEKTDLGHVRQQSVTSEKVFNRTRG